MNTKAVSRIPSPQYGDQVYRCLTGELETQIFLDIVMLSSQRPVWRLRGLTTRRTRIVAICEWSLTKKEAWEKYLTSCRDEHPELCRIAAAAQRNLDHCEAEIIRVMKLIADEEVELDRVHQSKE